MHPGLLDGVVDPDAVRDPDRPSEHAGGAWASGGVVSCELDQRAVAKPIEARVADVHEMRLPSPQHQRREGAGPAVERGIGAAERMNPAIDALERHARVAPHTT